MEVEKEKKGYQLSNFIFWLKQTLIHNICSCKSLPFYTLNNVTHAGLKHFKKRWGQNLPSLRWGILIKLLLERYLNCTLLDHENHPSFEYCCTWSDCGWPWLSAPCQCLHQHWERVSSHYLWIATVCPVESHPSPFSCHPSFVSLSRTWAGGYCPVSPGFTCISQSYTSAI